MKEFVKRILPSKILHGIYYTRKYGVRAAADKALHGVDLDAPGTPNGRQILYERFLEERAQRKQEQHPAGETEAGRQNERVCFAVVLRPGRSLLYQEADLRETVVSLQSQTYGNWMLVLENPQVWDAGLVSILEKEQDERIHSKMFSGENMQQDDSAGIFYRMAVRCGDTFSEDAFARLAKEIRSNGFPDILYTDHDSYDRVSGRYSDPCLKPDYAPEYLESDDYISDLCLFSDAVLARAGGWGGYAYDRTLRCVEQTEQIVHVPQILFHKGKSDVSSLSAKERRMEKKLREKQNAGPSSDGKNDVAAGSCKNRKKQAQENADISDCRAAAEAKRRALEVHFARLGRNVEVTADVQHGVCHSRYLMHKQPLVSILIPNKDHVEDLQRCLWSLNTLTYPNFEVVVIENNSSEPETFAFYEQLLEKERIQVVFWKDAFNFSAINNFGASYAQGEYLLFLNNDTQVISADLLEQMLGHFEKEAVGIVGARLLYDDDTVQHAGIVVGESGVADPLFVGARREDACYMKRAVCAQDYSAVTAACMLVSREVFDVVGGMSEFLPVAYNDIDFCMKVRALEKRIVYEPCAQMYHFESKSRGYENTPEKQARMEKERDTFAAQWKDVLAKPDPYFHPLLSVGPETGRLDIHSL